MSGAHAIGWWVSLNLSEDTCLQYGCVMPLKVGAECSICMVQSGSVLPPSSILGNLAHDEADDESSPVVLTVRDGAPLQLSVEQIKRMTWQELSRIWKVTELPYV